jgi:hypothetical protein
VLFRSLVTVAGLAVLGMVTAVAALRPEETGAELTRALNDAGLIGFGVIAPTFAVFFLSTALIVLRTGVLPAWLGWLALLGAASVVLGLGSIFEDSGTFSADGFLGFTLGFIVWLAWVLAASVAMLVGARASSALVRPPPRSDDQHHRGCRRGAAHNRLRARTGRSAMTGRALTNTARKPAEPWRRRLIRSLLYGRNVDRAAKARARAFSLSRHAMIAPSPAALTKAP